MSVPDQKPAEGKAASPDSRKRRERARTAVIVGLAVVITVFAFLNLKEVKVDWVVGSGHAPLIIVIVVSVLIGAVISYFADRRAAKRR
ncbi:MAG TPA: hypothetical protein VH115_05670 [Solirubrobacteraceae bacterium]|nr:hypothetical protein [Solirubrobacteraceae bacterium]